MTIDTYQQSWYTGALLITKLEHYFMVTVSVNPFLGLFEIIPNPDDIGPLMQVNVFYSQKQQQKNY